MGNILFWQRWPTPDRILFNIAALLFILSIAGLGYSYLTTPSPVVGFQSVVETQLTEVPFESFRKGVFELTVPGNNFTITERLLGTPLEPNMTANYLWLVCFALCISGLLAVVTTLSRYYYLACMGIFILLVVSLKLETLLMFGRSDKAFTIGTLIAYGLGSFHIYYFLPGLKLVPRMLYMLAITIISGVLIYFFSGAESPALHMATYSFPVGVIACGLLVITVAHEIIASFINILTRNTRQGRTLNHFLIITLIYLLNLVALYSIKFGFIKWNIFTINPYLLLIVSGILGIWGIRQRQKQFEGIIDAEPHAVIGFTLLGSMGLGAVALFLATANDPAYDAVADIIIFSHLGYGLIFLMYVISNFGGMLSNNMAVHKVLYNPTSMPFFAMRLAGLITTLALVIYNSWQVPAHNAVAGFQNAVGDLYLSEGNTRVAAVYYDQGRTYGFSNHRSNYALANLAGLKLDHDGEKGFYKSASYLRPTEMSILNWAQMWQSEENISEAIAVLKEGLREFPRSTAISNSLGLLYAEANNPDTAALYLQSLPSDHSTSNLLALAARKQLPLLADTSYRQSDPAGVVCNKIAFATSQGRELQVPLTLPADTAISTAQAAYINNYIVNHPGHADTVALARIESLARLDVNAGIAEALLFATALGTYSAGDIQKAFRLMEEVAIVSTAKGKYNNILALWCLEQDEPLRAQGYIEYALSQQYLGAMVTNAVALTEGLPYAPLDRSVVMKQTLSAWDSLRRLPDSTISKLAVRMTNVLTAPASSVESMTNEDKYAYVRYRVQPWDTTTSIRILSGITDSNLMVRGMLESSQHLLDYDKLEAAVSVFDRVRGVRVTDARLYDDLRLHERLLLAVSGNVDALRTAKETPLIIDDKRSAHQLYFDALLANSPGDSTVASKNFAAIANRSLFFDEGVLEAARFFSTHGTDILRSYNLLVDAVQHHPASIRLRKAYIREAVRVGFSDFATSAMQDLSRLIPPNDYAAFVREVGITQ